MDTHTFPAWLRFVALIRLARSIHRWIDDAHEDIELLSASSRPEGAILSGYTRCHVLREIQIGVARQFVPEALAMGGVMLSERRRQEHAGLFHAVGETLIAMQAADQSEAIGRRLELSDSNRSVLLTSTEQSIRAAMTQIGSLLIYVRSDGTQRRACQVFAEQATIGFLSWVKLRLLFAESQVDSVVNAAVEQLMCEHLPLHNSEQLQGLLDKARGFAAADLEPLSARLWEIEAVRRSVFI